MSKCPNGLVFIQEYESRPDYSNGASNTVIRVAGSTNAGDSVVFDITDSTHYYVIFANVALASYVESAIIIEAYCDKSAHVTTQFDNLSLFNKKISVMGDSISSYQSQVPSGNTFYYPRGDVTLPQYMWWFILAQASGMLVSTINAYSGTTVSGTSASACSSDGRTSNMGAPDIIVCYCGINDYINAVPLGTVNPLVAQTVDNFAGAYITMIQKLQTNYPNAKIYCGTLCPNTHPEDATITDSLSVCANPAGITLKQYNDTIREIAEYYGCGIIDFNACGITLKNLADLTVDEITDTHVHPNKNAHMLMAKEALHAIC